MQFILEDPLQLHITEPESDPFILQVIRFVMSCCLYASSDVCVYHDSPQLSHADQGVVEHPQ